MFENHLKCLIWIFGNLAFLINFCPIKTVLSGNTFNMSHLNFRILASSANICPIKIDLSGNTVWSQPSFFQKLTKIDHFWHFLITFVHSKCKHSSLRSQWWMRLFGRFSNTLQCVLIGNLGLGNIIDSSTFSVKWVLVFGRLYLDKNLNLVAMCVQSWVKRKTRRKNFKFQCQRPFWNEA